MESVESLAERLKKGDRRALAKAITLIESKKPQHRRLAARLLEMVLPESGNSVRIGISGVPGVGKSTFIEAFGMYLIEKGHRVAVLAIDPSSRITGGSILGDKTRMERLSRQENAFIRPSPSGDALGGVARKTREAIFLCEANGYDVVIVETVGVGQSEVTVASMVDFFVLMLLPNAGDELQGIKRGVMEFAHAVVINKADGDNLQRAQVAKKQMENALCLLHPVEQGWRTPVILASAYEGRGIDELWRKINEYVAIQKKSGAFELKRLNQSKEWMRNTVIDGLMEILFTDPELKRLYSEMERAVERRVTTPSLAAEKVLEYFKKKDC